MKKMIAMLAALLFAVSAFAQDGRSIYKKYSDAREVSAVYVSPAMFRMIGRLPDVAVGGDGVNLAPILKTLDGMYLIDSENQAINNDIRRDVEKMVSSGRYETLMEVKDSGETVHIYTSRSEDEITGFVLLSFGDRECTFICLDGRMPRKEFEDMMANAMK